MFTDVVIGLVSLDEIGYKVYIMSIIIKNKLRLDTSIEYKREFFYAHKSFVEQTCPFIECNNTTRN